MQTPCKNCCFAKYEDITQIGCDIGMLDKHTLAGVDIIEAYDEEKEFYVIDNFCNRYRSQKWLEKHKDKTPKELSVITRNEIKIPYQVIVVGAMDKTKVSKTLDSLSNQNIKPKHITVMRQNVRSVPETELIEMLQKLHIKWRLQTNKLKELELGNYIDMVIDVTPKTCLYYLVVFEGTVLPPTVSTELDEAINDKLVNFAAILPNVSGEGLIIPRSIHKILSGNAGKPLLQKIRDNNGAMMKIEEICPSFPK